ncbi:hypothetical protein [Nocardia violaceofusca]|uniref:hypothetical protein n=1 Tax=Nocardia violaceofusca TaxID=941182 RepID=UPI0007A3F014|nr:hypothetical protein [Nocardia violaceofusca]
MPSNNPAQRLADLLDQLRKVEQGAPLKQSLEIVFGASNDTEFIQSFGYFVALPAKIEPLVTAAADKDHDDLQWLLSWKPKVDGVIGRMWSLTSTTQGVTQFYGDPEISVLRACSGLLSRAGVEPRVDNDKLVELNESITTLYSDLLADTEVPSPLKEFILEQLSRIQSAIRLCVVRGPKALEEAVETSIGAVAIKGPQMVVNNPTPKTRGFMDRFRAVLAAVTLTMTTGEKVLTTGVEAHKALEQWGVL